FDQQAAELGVHGFDHAVLDNAHAQRAVFVAVGAAKRVKRAGAAWKQRHQVFGRLLPRRVRGAVAYGGHPGLVGRTGIDPLDGGVGLDGGAIAAGARVIEFDLFSLAVLDDDQGRHVIGVLAIEIGREGRRAAGGVGVEDPARRDALQARRVFKKRIAGDDLAASVGLIAGAGIGAEGLVIAGNETAHIRAFFG